MKVDIGFVVLALFGGMVAQDQMSAQDVKWKDYGEDPMANPQFMQDWNASAEVGEHHKTLQQTAGTFEVAGKMWMGPGTEAMPSTATASRKSLLGGRYVMEEYKSSFMGMPFEGVLLQGYDNLAGEHFSIWMDSMSTWPSISRGKMGEDGKIHYTGTMKDVMTPGGRPTSSTIEEHEGGGWTMAMFDSTPTGDEFKVMELNYAAKK